MKVQRLTPPSHHVYDYNLKKLQELRPSGKSWHKIFVLLGRLSEYFDHGTGPRILVLGEASNKIFSKVARISVRGGDIQQKFTQQQLLKNLYKIYTKI